MLVGGTGIEPVTSSVSGKRSPAELSARRGGSGNRTRVQGFAGPCLSHSAIPPQADPLGAGPVPKSRADRRHARRLPAPPSGRRDSNPRPSPWQGDALPAALRPLATGPTPPRRPTPGAFRTVADPARRANSHTRIGSAP